MLLFSPQRIVCFSSNQTPGGSLWNCLWEGVEHLGWGLRRKTLPIC